MCKGFPKRLKTGNTTSPHLFPHFFRDLPPQVFLRYVATRLLPGDFLSHRWLWWRMVKVQWWSCQREVNGVIGKGSWTLLGRLKKKHAGCLKHYNKTKTVWNGFVLLVVLFLFCFWFVLFCFLLFVCLLVTVFAWMVMVRGVFFSGLAKRILDHFSFFCLDESLEN